MTELGQLHRQHKDFAARGVRIVVSSLEGPEDARQTAQEFPRLVVLSDAEGNLTQAAESLHAGSNPYGGDTSAPTNILIDESGTIRWVFRPTRYLVRATPQQVLEAIDERLKPGSGG